MKETTARYSGSMATEQTFYSDLDTVDGLVFPFESETFAGGKPVSDSTTTLIEVNAAVSEDKFKRPAQ